jgi:hypothetical protein
MKPSLCRQQFIKWHVGPSNQADIGWNGARPSRDAEIYSRMPGPLGDEPVREAFRPFGCC